MIRVLLIATLLTVGASSAVSACCLLGVQGRPHGGKAVIRAYNWRHGLGYRVHPRRPVDVRR